MEMSWLAVLAATYADALNCAAFWSRMFYESSWFLAPYAQKSMMIGIPKYNHSYLFLLNGEWIVGYLIIYFLQ